ncbi:hypothetical protein ASPWEDRAFT_356200 [Aspergillus wentii DTO 134E9]|uniref:Uncharacterized protein n=1 Tax=Aspergillus wentii DTO 134E9 TaxID=1073089 RepID=A0A1L9RW60_ASPWE|nr:uncharacterized protein ASPWEDRAFT_356200 [Aspergillus wentii DTO 134E9]OJJ39114.1 hypothetical protein ASPWEDRAFT_356200 [Aspergillus wentii DTO 134E9]
MMESVQPFGFRLPRSRLTVGDVRLYTLFLGIQNEHFYSIPTFVIRFYILYWSGTFDSFALFTLGQLHKLYFVSIAHTRRLGLGHIMGNKKFRRLCLHYTRCALEGIHVLINDCLHWAYRERGREDLLHFFYSTVLPETYLRLKFAGPWIRLSGQTRMTKLEETGPIAFGSMRGQGEGCLTETSIPIRLALILTLSGSHRLSTSYAAQDLYTSQTLFLPVCVSYSGVGASYT